MEFYLELVVSSLFLANRILVLYEKKVGWLLGALGASLGLVYFYLIGLYVYTVLEVGLIILMGYGYLKGPEINQSVKLWLQASTGVIMFVLGITTFAGLLTAIELVSSLLLLAGTYVLANKTATVGWAMFFFAHITAAYLGFEKEQLYFASQQIASALISVIGVYRCLNNQKATQG